MRPIALPLALILLAGPALADWTLDDERSTMGFVTIKNGDTAEASMFSGLEGGVAEDGTATISIPLASVETFIDIRNERMRELLFRVADFPMATVTASIDMDALAALAPGDRAMSDVEITVAVNGAEADYPGSVSITRIDEGTVAVGTARPLIADARDLGYEGGLDDLREIAGLDAISPAVPVTFDLLFTR